MKSVDPKVWGPSAWMILHRLSFKFKNIQEAHDFYNTLKILLPCYKCRNNFTEHLKMFPKNIDELPEWLWRVHAKVNSDKKPKVDFDSVVKRYSHSSLQNQEWIFIDSIIKTHPGSFQILECHLNALKLFFKCWLDNSKSIQIPDRYDSKLYLKEWKKKYTNLHIKNKSCSKEICMI